MVTFSVVFRGFDRAAKVAVTFLSPTSTLSIRPKASPRSLRRVTFHFVSLMMLWKEYCWRSVITKCILIPLFGFTISNHMPS